MSENREALDAFFRSVERKGFRMAEIGTSNRDDALDIVQDVMMKFVQKYAHKPQESWKPLFFRMVQNKIKDWYRWNSVKKTLFGLIAKDDQSQDSIERFEDKKSKNPENEAMQSGFHALLTRALKGLPRRQQQAFLLRAWEELSVKETAVAMGCSEGSVKTHYSRALSALKVALPEDVG